MDSMPPSPGRAPAPAAHPHEGGAPALPPPSVSPTARPVFYAPLPPTGPYRWPERGDPHAPAPAQPYWRPALPRIPPRDDPRGTAYARAPHPGRAHFSSDPGLEAPHMGPMVRPRPVHLPISDPSGLAPGPLGHASHFNRSPTVHPQYYGPSSASHFARNDRGAALANTPSSWQTDAAYGHVSPRRSSTPHGDWHMPSRFHLPGQQGRAMNSAHWEPCPLHVPGPTAPSSTGVSQPMDLSPTEPHADPTPTDPTDKASPASGSEGSARQKPSAQGRRRRFKYLNARVKDSLDPKTLDSRKKVKRACVFCRRSHMPCEFRRPCGRCIKRGIAHLCTDDGSTSPGASASSAPTTAGFADDGAPSAEGSESISQASSRTMTGPLASGAKARHAEDETGDGRSSTSPVSNWQHSPSRTSDPAAERGPGSGSATGLTVARHPPIPISLATDEPAAGAQDLPWGDGEGEVSLLDAADDAVVVSKLLQSEWCALTEKMLNGDWPTRDHELSFAARQLYHDNPPMQRLVHYPASVIQEEVLTLVALDAPNGPGRWGYGLIAEWLRESFDNDTRLSIDRTLAMVRLRYLRLGLVPLAHQDRIDVAFNNLVKHYRLNVFESVPSAMALMTRSGKIFTGNTRLVEWLQLPPEILFTKSVLYFSLVAGPDVAKVIEAYASAATSEEANGDPAPMNGTTRSRGDVTLTHAFVVDRQAHIMGQRAWSQRDMQHLPQAPRALEDGSPSVVRFRAHVTIQPILDPTANGVPHFFAIYISSMPAANDASIEFRAKAGYSQSFPHTDGDEFVPNFHPNFSFKLY